MELLPWLCIHEYMYMHMYMYTRSQCKMYLYESQEAFGKRLLFVVYNLFAIRIYYINSSHILGLRSAHTLKIY